MKVKTILSLLFISLAISLPAQKQVKGDTILIEGETIEIRVPAKMIPVVERPEPVVEVEQVEAAIREELDTITGQKKDQEIISDNVVINVEVAKADKDLKVVYSYSLINDTLKFQTDDFGLGRYRVDESNALLVTLQVMEENVKGHLAKYVTPVKQISITINGSADATPIRGIIPYKGEYGDPIDENCSFEGRSEKTEISTGRGISDNSILAFVRSIAVKDYIARNILDSTFTKLTYYHSATVSGQRGGQYRRVSIEMIVYNAFAE